MKNIIDEKIFTPQELEWLHLAQQMGHQAGKVLRNYFRRRDLGIQDKGNAYDIVTEADKASERLILDLIHDRFLKMGLGRSETLITFKEVFKRQIPIAPDSGDEVNV